MRGSPRRGAALGCLADYESNATLGAALLDEDRTVRILAKNSIRQVWTRRPGEQGPCPTRNRHSPERRTAVREGGCVASDLIKRVPAFAKAWNQRAYAHHALGHYDDSVRDCHAALEINPYHFIAALSMGRAYPELGDRVWCWRLPSGLGSIRSGRRSRQADRLAKLVEGS